MIDLTQYSDDELSLHVFNTECLYTSRHDLPVLLEIVQDNFKYKQEQLDTLLQDILDDTD